MSLLAQHDDTIRWYEFMDFTESDSQLSHKCNVNDDPETTEIFYVWDFKWLFCITYTSKVI